MFRPGANLITLARPNLHLQLERLTGKFSCDGSWKLNFDEK